MVEDLIPRNAGRFNDHFPSRSRRPSFSSALLEAISRSTDTNASGKSLDMQRKSRDSRPNKPHQHFHLEEQFLSESPRLEMTHTRRPLRRSLDDFRLSHRATMKKEPPLPPPPPPSKKQMKVKSMSPGSKLASFLNSLFTPRKSHEKVTTPPPGSFSHSASMSSRSASSPSSKRVSNYKRYDLSGDDASLPTNPKPFSVNNSPSAVKTQNHKSVTFCPRNVMLDENYNRWENENISREKQHGKHSFHHRQVLYEAEEEEEEVGSDSSSDLFELENLNVMHMDMDLPVFGTTHLETIQGSAKGLLDKRVNVTFERLHSNYI